MPEGMLPNADFFNDLCDEDRTALLSYIESNFKQVKTFNKQQSAYWLKTRFNRLTVHHKKHHITSRCFMEAMVASGFKALPVPGSENTDWYFNVGKVHFTD